MKRLRKKRGADELDEDDLALIQEGKSAQQPQEPPTAKRVRSGESPAKLEGDLFGGDDESGDEVEEIVGKVKDTAEGMGGYDSDNFDDFIEDDLGDQKKIRRLEKDLEAGGINAVSDAQLDEARDIFGDGYLDFIREGDDEDDDDDVDHDDDDDMFGEDDDEEKEETEEDKLTSMDRMLARKAERVRKKAAKKRAYLRSAFEPSQLVEHYITEKDEKIRLADVPERLFSRLSTRGNLSELELEQMSHWIFNKSDKMSGALSLALQTGQLLIKTTMPINTKVVTLYNKRSSDVLGDKCIDIIQKVITMLHKDKFEVPYIKTYCRDEVAGFNSAQAIWEARDFNIEEVAGGTADGCLFKLMDAFTERKQRFNKYCAQSPHSAEVGVEKSKVADYVEFMHKRATTKVFDAMFENLWEVMDLDEEWEMLQEKKHKAIRVSKSNFADLKTTENLQDKADEAQLLLPDAEIEYEQAKVMASEARVELNELGPDPAALASAQKAATEVAEGSEAATTENESGSTDQSPPARPTEEQIATYKAVKDKVRAYDLLVYERSQKVDSYKEALAAASASASDSTAAFSSNANEWLYNPHFYALELEEAKDEEFISDMHEYMSLIKEGNAAIASSSNDGDQPPPKRTSRRVDRDYYRSCVGSGYRKVAYNFMPPTYRAGYVLENVCDVSISASLSMTPRPFNYSAQIDPSDDGNPSVWSPRTPDQPPDDFADKMIMDSAVVLQNDDEDTDHTEAVLRASRYVAAMELSHEPRVKGTLRKIYYARATVSTSPTAKGRSVIDAFHEVYGLHMIRNKPVANYMNKDDLSPGDKCEYLKMLKAERDGLITIAVGLPKRESQELKKALELGLGAGGTIGGEKIEVEVDVKPFLAMMEPAFMHTGDDEQDWNKQRLMVQKQALLRFLFPKFEKECRVKMYQTASECGIEEAAASLEKIAMQGPLTPAWILNRDPVSGQIRPPGLSVVGVCVANTHKEASYLIAMRESGDITDFRVIPAGQRAEDLTGDLTKFFVIHRPSLVAIGTSGGMMSKHMFNQLQTIVSSAKLKFNNRKSRTADDDYLDEGDDLDGVIEDFDMVDNWEVEVSLVDDSIPQLYARSPRGAKEFPNYAVEHKSAIATARFVRSPLSEVCGVWSVVSEKGVHGIELLYLNVHPLQNILPKATLLKFYERKLIDSVSAVGVEVNELGRDPSTVGLLQFVPGFGPRKSLMFMQNLKAVGNRIVNRQDILMETSLGIEQLVFQNAAAFLRVGYRDEHDLENDKTSLFDTTRVHPEAYIKNEWAEKIVCDALSDDPDAKRMHTNEKIDAVMKDCSQHIIGGFCSAEKAHNDYVRDSGDTNRIFEAYLYDPFKMIAEENPALPEETFDDLIGELDLDAYNTMLKKDNGEKRCVLELIKRELRFPFKDPRTPMRQLSARPANRIDQKRLFNLLTGESDASIRPGNVVVAECLRPGEYGVRIKLDNGLNGNIHRNFIKSKTVVEDVSAHIKKGQVVTCVVKEVRHEHLSVECSMTDEDLSRRDYEWARPSSLPTFSRYFDRSRAQEALAKRHAKEAQAGIQRANKENSSASSAAAPSRRVVTMRATLHPAFRNKVWKEIKAELDGLGDKAAGTALVHPSSSAVDKLTLTWCLKAGVYKNFEILEKEKATEASIGRKLILKDEEYGDLDEIIGRFVEPLNDLYSGAFESPKVMETDDMEEVDKALRVQKVQKPNSIPYIMATDSQLPGNFQLRFLPNTTIKSEWVVLHPNGYTYRNRAFPKLNKMFDYFKQNAIKRPEPLKAMSSNNEASKKKASRWDIPAAPPQVPANFAPPPNFGGAALQPPAIQQPPPSFSQPPPNFLVPPPNFGAQALQRPPDFSQPPPNLSQPPPNLSQPPSNFSQPPPPNFSQPPPNFRAPPPNFRPQQPPPNFRPQPPPSSAMQAPPSFNQPPPPTFNNQQQPPPNFNSQSQPGQPPAAFSSSSARGRGRGMGRGRDSTLPAWMTQKQ